MFDLCMCLQFCTKCDLLIGAEYAIRNSFRKQCMRMDFACSCVGNINHTSMVGITDHKRSKIKPESPMSKPRNEYLFHGSVLIHRSGPTSLSGQVGPDRWINNAQNQNNGRTSENQTRLHPNKTQTETRTFTSVLIYLVDNLDDFGERKLALNSESTYLALSSW